MSQTQEMSGIPQNHMTASGATGHTRLATANGYLISPLQIGNAGDTKT